MNKKIYEFEAVIKKVPDINGAYIEFPYDVREEFGKGRVKVHATFDGEEYDGSLVRMICLLSSAICCGLWHSSFQCSCWIRSYSSYKGGTQLCKIKRCRKIVQNV